jgi:anti-anti-sigma factor
MQCSESPAELVEIHLGPLLTHVAIRGNLDIEGTKAVETRFALSVAGRRLPAIVDLSAVGFVTSYAIGMLVSASRSLRSRDRLLVLVGPTGKVAEVLAASRLHLAMPIVATEAEAKALIDAGAGS